MTFLRSRKARLLCFGTLTSLCLYSFGFRETDKYRVVWKKKMSEEKKEAGTSSNNKYKILWCIRHAESQYNESVRAPKTWVSPNFWANKFDPRIHDPLVSKKGATQIQELKNHLESWKFLENAGIELVIVSPLRRAMQTALGTLNLQDANPTNTMTNFSPETSINPTPAFQTTIMAHYLLREWMDTLGDVGHKRSELQAMPEFKIVNLELCMPNEVWWCAEGQKDDTSEKDKSSNNGSVVKESKAQIHERIKKFKDFIVNQREEDNILLVGHSRWFRELVGSKEKLNNCEMMRVVVDKKTGDVISYQVVNFKLHKNFASFIESSISD